MRVKWWNSTPPFKWLLGQRNEKNRKTFIISTPLLRTLSDDVPYEDPWLAYMKRLMSVTEAKGLCEARIVLLAFHPARTRTLILFIRLRRSKKEGYLLYILNKTWGVAVSWARPFVEKEIAVWNAAYQHATFRKLGGKRGAEYLNTKFPLPTLFYGGYSVKLFF